MTVSKVGVDFWKRRLDKVKTVRELEMNWLDSLPTSYKRDAQMLDLFKRRREQLGGEN